mgnify:CR=1 FL=1
MLVTSGKSFRKIRQKLSMLFLIQVEPDFWTTVYMQVHAYRHFLFNTRAYATRDVDKDARRVIIVVSYFFYRLRHLM